MTYVPYRDDEASKLGMWLFLMTEVLLFGGLFLVYSIYRSMNSAAFNVAAHEHLNVIMGTINTFVLITSSFTVAMSVTAIQKKDYKFASRLLIATLFFALVFMVVKYFEWSAKFEHGIYPGSEHFLTLPQGQGLFFLLYFLMTGLHGFHVIVGGIFIGVMLRRLKKGNVTFDNYSQFENSALYWHLVDLIWIFLFPLFYLIT